MLLINIFTDFLYLTTQFLIFKFILKYKFFFFTSFVGALGLIQLEMHLFLSTYYFTEAANVCAFMLSLMLICEKVNIIQHQQANYLLGQCTRSFVKTKHISVQLNKYFNYHTKCCLSMLSINKIQGVILLNAIVSSTPTSAYLVILTFQNKFINVSQLIMGLLIMLGQLISVFGMHLSAISFGTRLHSCCPQLIKLYTYNMLHKSLNFKMQLKLANYYQKYWTKNFYTITYGPIGPATFKSFSRVFC